jgi:hypothetical protein
MAKREAQYRGYKIEVEGRGQEWRVSVTPTRPELPILREHSFKTEGSTSSEGAIAVAVHRIDKVLH